MKSLLTIFFFCGLAPWALAEPYLAVQYGYSCPTCHVNPTGGGQRTIFGNAFAEKQLIANPLDGKGSPWTGTIVEPVRIGANARASARQYDFDDRDDSLDFGVDRVSLYLSAELNEHVLFYVDQQVAPGGSLNREAWARLGFGDWSLKAGKIFLPLGWRLEDDTALVRTATGINMTQGDNGLEIGYDTASFSFQLAATNGTGGASEIDDGKLFATRLEWSGSGWRAGLGGLNNSTDFGDRWIYGVFAGFKTGPVSWLLEYDRIEDRDSPTPDLTQDVALLEANIALKKGHNLKISLEGQGFDDDQEDRFRGSIVYEYFPWPYTEFRLGLRERDSDDEAASLNSEEGFVQLQVFF